VDSAEPDWRFRIRFFRPGWLLVRQIQPR